MYRDGCKQEIDDPGKQGQQGMKETAKRNEQQHCDGNSGNMGFREDFAKGRCHTVTVARHYLRTYWSDQMEFKTGGAPID